MIEQVLEFNKNKPKHIQFDKSIGYVVTTKGNKGNIYTLFSNKQKANKFLKSQPIL